MECVQKYLDNLSQFRAADLSQCQTTLVFGLGAVGGAFILCHALTFLRVLLSLFVLPGKSVSCVCVSWHRETTDKRVVEKLRAQGQLGCYYRSF